MYTFTSNRCLLYVLVSILLYILVSILLCKLVSILLYTSQYTPLYTQTILRTDDMDPAGDVIQSLAAYLGIEVRSVTHRKLVLSLFL